MPKSSSTSHIAAQINKDAHAQQALTDISEVLIDQTLEGLAKDIPVISTVINLYKTTKSIQQKLAIRKLVLFVEGLSDLPQSEKAKLQTLFEGNEEKQRAFAENILLALDRHDSLEKPLLLVKFFRAFISDRIDLLTFSRLKQALEKFNLSMEPYLRIFYGEQLLQTLPVPAHSEEIHHELSLSGFATVSLEASGTIGGSAMYIRNSIGLAFIEIGLNNNIDYSNQVTPITENQL